MGCGRLPDSSILLHPTPGVLEMLARLPKGIEISQGVFAVQGVSIVCLPPAGEFLVVQGNFLWSRGIC